MRLHPRPDLLAQHHAQWALSRWHIPFFTVPLAVPQPRSLARAEVPVGLTYLQVGRDGGLQ